MMQLSEILRRLRENAGTNQIQRELGTHKTVITRVRRLANQEGWLDENIPLPDEHTIHEKYRLLFSSKPQAHLLDAFYDAIKEWREHGESYVVIRHKLNERLGSETVKDTALRDWCRRKLPLQIPIKLRREMEFGVAELDFGYLGKTQDEDGKLRKTWFISVRFRGSRHAYREIMFRTDTPRCIQALENAFAYFEGVPRMLVIDNFKAAVKRAHLYDPTITKTFYDFAKHTGFLLAPCAPYRPEHKGGVESDVKYVKKNFLPLLKDYERQRGFETIRACVINERFAWWNQEIAMKRKIREAGNRTVRELFEEEFTHLRPIPEIAYQIVEWASVNVRLDWHVQYDRNYYSVPYQHRGKTAEIRATEGSIEVFVDHQLVAHHVRCRDRGKRITVREHGPQASMEYLTSNRAFILGKAQSIGPHAVEVVQVLLNDSVVDRTRSARGIVFLTKKYPAHRIEKACERALFFSVPHYHNIKHILEKGLDAQPCEYPVDAHGQQYFQFARDRRYYH
jgi:uncharacterized protein (UPF0248 family)